MRKGSILGDLYRKRRQARLGQKRRKPHRVRKLKRRLTRALAAGDLRTGAQIEVELKRLTGGEVEPDFYDSPAWRRLRYAMIREFKGPCPACLRTREALVKAGIGLRVNHLQPRSKYPALALVKLNLKVLCAECSLGKLSRSCDEGGG